MDPRTVFTLVAVPALIVILDRAEARFGASLAGWLSGFPIIGGPALLIVAIERGSEFAASATLSALQGIPAWSAFILTYRYADIATADPSKTATLLAAVTFWAATGLLMTSFQAPTWLWPVFLLYAVVLLSRVSVQDVEPKAPPRVVFLGRLVLAPAFLLLTLLGANGVASIAGGRIAGLLVAYPIVSSTLLISAASRDGVAYTKPMTSGMISAGPGFATFLLVLALTLRTSSTTLAFGTATVVGLAAHVLARRVFRAAVLRDHELVDGC